MAIKRNLMVKVVDAKAGDVKKALKEAGIEVTSIVEVHKEDTAEPESEEPAAEQQN